MTRDGVDSSKASCIRKQIGSSVKADCFFGDESRKCKTERPIARDLKSDRVRGSVGANAVECVTMVGANVRFTISREGMPRLPKNKKFDGMLVTCGLAAGSSCRVVTLKLAPSCELLLASSKVAVSNEACWSRPLHGCPRCACLHMWLGTWEARNGLTSLARGPPSFKLRG